MMMVTSFNYILDLHKMETDLIWGDNKGMGEG